MRIHSITVVKNEVTRYLQAHMEWHRGQFDSRFFYDDQSNDPTPRMLSRYPESVVVSRPDGVQSFMQHEGNFRQAAYNAWIKEVEPTPGDWVVAIDADEFLVSDYGALYQALNLSAQAASAAGAASLMIKIPEMWNINPLDQRIDGFWGKIESPRVFRYLPPVEINKKSMGCGSWPTYVDVLEKHPCNLLSLLHFGYAEESDRREKHARYVAHSVGHSMVHINSIVSTPVLSPWTGAAPKVWQGVLA